MRSDGSGVRRSHRGPAGRVPSGLVSDGRRIAFNAGSVTASDIYLVNLDGSGLTVKITREARAAISTPIPGRRMPLDWRSAPIETVIGTSM